MDYCEFGGGGGAGGVMYGGWGFEWLKMMERMGWINEQMIVGAGGGGDGKVQVE